jgi:MFS family permease
MALAVSETQRRRQLGVILPACTAMALSLAGDLTLYAVLPAYAAGLAIGLANIGILLSANRFIRLISNPLVGMLVDRFGRRRIVLAGLLTGVLSTLLYVWASGFWLFLLGRLLWGVSWSFIYIGVYCMTLDVTTQADRGWGSGILQTFYFAGLSINPLLGGLLSNWLGFSYALVACAGLQALGLAVALVSLPETLPPQERRSIPVGEAWSALRSKIAGFIKGLKANWPQRSAEVLTANYLYLLILFIGDGIIMSTITLYLKTRYGDTLSLAGLALPVATAGGGLLAVRAAVSAAAAPLAGRWSDRHGARWPAVTWGALAALAGCLALGFDGSPWLAAAGVALAAAGSGVIMSVIPVIISSIFGSQKNGLGLGLLNNAGDIGCAVAPLVSYALVGSVPLSTIYLCAGALLATGILPAARQGGTLHKLQ